MIEARGHPGADIGGGKHEFPAAEDQVLGPRLLDLGFGFHVDPCGTHTKVSKCGQCEHVCIRFLPNFHMSDAPLNPVVCTFKNAITLISRKSEISNFDPELRLMCN